jgi:lipoate---protein ligase
MKLYNLGKVPWLDSQLIYHALAHMGQEALSLVSPAQPYVCIGFHQDAEQEVDLDFCRQNNIPVFRRDLGGGAVYLDGGQLFFHLILHRDNPIIPKGKTTFYKKFLQPIINVHQRIGIPVTYKPVNDLLAGNCKISGTGAAEIGDCIVFVGNLIVDFNYKMMSRVLKVPNEKFRDKVHQTLRENLTTIQRELGEETAGQWNEARLNGLIAEEFEALVGPMQPTFRDTALQSKMDECGETLLSDDWLYRKGKVKASGRDIKIRAGVEMLHRMHKAPGGLIRAEYAVVDGCFENLHFSGDYFCFPSSAIEELEKSLNRQPVTEAGKILKTFYAQDSLEIPGVAVEDWLTVLKV